MTPESSTHQQDAPDQQAATPETWRYSAASAGTQEQAERSVMHPEAYDPEWRYYHGAWGG